MFLTFFSVFATIQLELAIYWLIKQNVMLLWLGSSMSTAYYNVCH